VSEQQISSEGAIGILDSGVGGLSVLREIQVLLPAEKLLYFADQAHVPYGSRPAEEVRRYSEEISRFFLAQGAKLIVVACNTASAAALSHLRAAIPGVPFVGMEPAVKPGAVQTRNGRIGVLATQGTFGSERYASLMARYARGVLVYEDPCPGLVGQIEAGLLDDGETEAIVRVALTPMLSGGVDTLVLGCTHYPFVIPLIQRLAGPSVLVIDPAPAVARQVHRVLESQGLSTTSAVQESMIRAFTSAKAGRWSKIVAQIMGPDFARQMVTQAASWHPSGRLTAT
jgi:glutamate racemase